VVARAVVGVPTLLCLWISEIIAPLPGRCAVTVLELLTGTMLTGYGSISQAILAVPCRRHWTSYSWMVRKGKFDWKVMVHALCRIVKREFPSKRCVVVGDDTLIPRVSVLHGCAGWRRRRSISMLRISPSCRINTMLTVVTIFRDRSDA
jgi:hypothetical protein